MAVSVQYQTWTPAQYNWDSAATDSPVQQVCAALSSWITTINGNASQTGKQVSLIRDHNSSATTNYRGWVVQAPLLESATKSMFWSQFSYSSVANISKAHDDAFWVDNTANGGYGGNTSTALAAYYLADTKTHKHSVTTYGDIIVAYDTSNGQEFFSYSNLLDGDTTNNNDAFILAKDCFGNWCSISTDGTSRIGAFYDPYIDRVVYAGTVTSAITSDGGSSTLYVGGSPILYAPNPGVSDGATRRMAVCPANGAITVQSNSAAVYGYANLAGGDVALNLTASGPYIRYTP